MLPEHGLLVKLDSIIDPTFIEAIPSTTGTGCKQNLEMYQAKKGDKWHFGMTVHSGTDTGSGLAHSAETTPAYNHDIM